MIKMFPALIFLMYMYFNFHSQQTHVDIFNKIIQQAIPYPLCIDSLLAIIPYNLFIFKITIDYTKNLTTMQCLTREHVAMFAVKKFLFQLMTRLWIYQHSLKQVTLHGTMRPIGSYLDELHDEEELGVRVELFHQLDNVGMFHALQDGHLVLNHLLLHQPFKQTTLLFTAKSINVYNVFIMK